MANYYATARSNYFHVKDCGKFTQWCEDLDLEYWTKKGDIEEDPPLYAIASRDGEGWPTWNCEADREADIISEIVPHLAEGEVVILMEAGAEKLRYVHGEAIAISHTGESISINTQQIYEAVADNWGITDFTPAEF